MKSMLKLKSMLKRWRSYAALACLAMIGCGEEPREVGVAPAYPQGPYGTAVGDVVANLRFEGWMDPAAEAFDPAATQPIELGALYDPDGATGVKLIVVNACAMWCAPCHPLHAEELATNASELGPAVAIVATLAQDPDFMPMTVDALADWASELQVAVPLGADIDDQLGAFAATEAVPNFIVVNARDMRLLGVFEANDPTLWSFVAQKLEQIDAPP